ncbi:MAG: hypothetical protein JWM51_1972 [Microbacteriaceae bacterium]|nr:hypothetical protein [Microbacteriaceae bacterium]
MIIEFSIIAALAVAAVVGSIVTTVRDGYGQVPSHR